MKIGSRIEAAEAAGTCCVSLCEGDAVTNLLWYANGSRNTVLPVQYAMESSAQAGSTVSYTNLEFQEVEMKGYGPFRDSQVTFMTNHLVAIDYGCESRTIGC